MKNFRAFCFSLVAVPRSTKVYLSGRNDAGPFQPTRLVVSNDALAHLDVWSLKIRGEEQLQITKAPFPARFLASDDLALARIGTGDEVSMVVSAKNSVAASIALAGFSLPEELADYIGQCGYVPPPESGRRLKS